MEENVTSVEEKYKAIEAELKEFKEDQNKIEEILQTELKLVGEALNSANQEVTKIQKEINPLRKKNASSGTNTRKQQQNMTLTTKIVDLEGELTSKQQYVTELKKSQQGTKTELKEHKQQTDEQIKDYESQLKALNKEKKTGNVPLRAQVSKLQEELQIEKKNLETVNETHKIELSKIKEDFESEKKKLETACEKLKTELNQVQKDFESEKNKLKTVNSNLKADFTEFKKVFESEKKKIETISKDNKLKVTKLQGDLECGKKRLDNDNVQLRTEIAKLKDELQSEKKRMENEQRQLKIDISKYKEQSLVKDKQIIELTESLKSVKREMVESGSENVMGILNVKNVMAQLELLKLILQLKHDKTNKLDEEADEDLKSPSNRQLHCSDIISADPEPTTSYDKVSRTDDYKRLIDYGLNKEVAAKLEEIFRTGKLAPTDLEEWTLAALKEFPVDATLQVLNAFLSSKMEVSKIYSRLSSYMKNYHEKTDVKLTPACVKGPNEEKIKELLKSTGYPLKVALGHRQYGPPSSCTGLARDIGNEVTVTNIPADMYEDALVPIMKKPGKLWSLRLMMNPNTGQHTGTASVTYFSRYIAEKAVKQLKNYKMEDGKRLHVCLLVPCQRLLLGNIPQNKTHEQIFNSLMILTVGLKDVFYFDSCEADVLCKKFCVLEYDSYATVIKAKRRMENVKFNLFHQLVVVDWYDSELDRNQDMSKEKGVFIKNVPVDVSEQTIRNAFECFGEIVYIKKKHDYAFVHYTNREDAIKVMEMTDPELGGAILKIQLVMNKWDKEESLVFLQRRSDRMNALMQKLDSMDTNYYGASSSDNYPNSRSSYNFKDKRDKSGYGGQSSSSGKSNEHRYKKRKFEGGHHSIKRKRPYTPNEIWVKDSY